MVITPAKEQQRKLRAEHVIPRFRAAAVDIGLDAERLWERALADADAVADARVERPVDELHRPIDARHRHVDDMPARDVEAGSEIPYAYAANESPVLAYEITRSRKPPFVIPNLSVHARTHE